MAELELGTKGNPEIDLNINANDNLEIRDKDGNVILTLKQDQSISTEKQVISPSEWAVDGTISVSATQSTTYNLNNNYDWVIVDVDEIKNQSGDSQDLQIRLNGDSGSNYTEKDDSGVRSNTQTEWGLVEGIADNKTYAGPLWFDGRYSDFVTMRAWGSPSDFGATFNPNARNFNVGTPLNSIEIRGSAGDIDVEAAVRGRVIK